MAMDEIGPDDCTPSNDHPFTPLRIECAPFSVLGLLDIVDTVKWTTSWTERERECHRQRTTMQNMYIAITNLSADELMELIEIMETHTLKAVGWCTAERRGEPVIGLTGGLW